ncbi:MAG: esterase-like activity of phytase family protein [Cyanobacteria bacterium J06598_1]
MTLSLNRIGSFTSEIGAEIAAFDSERSLLYVVSGGTTLEVLDFSDPTAPSQLAAIDIADFSAPIDGANSIAYSNGLIAVALGAENVTDNGVVALVDIEKAIAATDVLDAVKVFTVGALPDMVTFTPDGSKILVANEGEADVTENDDGSITVVDPEGSVSIIDISGEFESLSNDDVSTADFTRFNDRKADLIGDGVRLFPDATVAQDLEPEYIAVSPDGTKAFVTLQENNAIAIVDIESAEIEAVQPLGLKDFSQGFPNLTNYDFVNRGDINNGGEALTTADGQTIELGGFSGLYYDGVAENGNLRFLAVPDRGPNGDADGNNRPFLLPDYQARIVSFELNESSGELTITDELLLKQADGTPITGLPNIPNVDRQAVDALGNPVDLPELNGFEDFGSDYDPFGADLESILRDNNGNFWTVDEYRPAIYQFDQDGTLLQRFVPEGTAAQAEAANPGFTFFDTTFGSETLPTDYLNRRANRGFEGAALDTETGIFYAFIQTPLSNPDRDASDASSVIRMLGIDPATGTPVSEYVYILQKPETGSNVDKIGDAVFAGDGKFFVIERDSDLSSTGQQFVFEVDIAGATNVLGQDFSGLTLEQQTPDSLADLGIQTISKTKVVNLPSVGYSPSDKPEGIALLPDGRLAVLNDNDFGLETGAEAVQLGIIDFTTNGAGLDASDRDGGININPEPVFGLYMPDSIASFESNGEAFYVIANEGDDRGDADEAGRGDAIRLKDLGDVVSFGRSGLSLDESIDPALLEDEELGRLTISSLDGDTDGDGDIDRIVSYGARSFSVLDSKGNIVFDSGDQIARITAELAPELFNANDGDPEEIDNRSDNKGAEPEAITTGVINGTPYAFVGLERAGGGVLVYELSDPSAPKFTQYIRSDEDIAPEGLVFIAAEDSPNGQPLLTVANEESNTVAVYEIDAPDTPDNFTLQLLHLGDQEAGIPALEDAPRASAVLNALRNDFENTLTLSSGDAIIPGLFFSASEEAFGGAGRADILIQNELGIQAIALGNHEFDLGTGLVRDLIVGGEDDPETPDVDESFGGTLFPYLSSNLDFSTSADLADLVVADDQAPLPKSIAATTVIDVNGEQIGVVGATTPTLPIISSPGDVTVLPEDFDGNPTAAQLDALAAEIQTDVDEMLAANPGLNKVVVLSHMQQIAIEQALATRLTNVDVIVAGGSNTRLADEDDRLRAGDEAQGTYPIFSTDADGKPVAIVNTDGNYKYIGRLVVEFDAEGNVIPESYDPSVSGAYATDEQGVADLGAEGLVDPEIQGIVDTLEEVIVAKESNVFGISDVYLNGLRGSVRTEETNLGNLTADANLAIAKEADSDVVISLKNGGGIRDDIGQRIVPAGGTGEPVLLPTEEIPGVKPAGGISETDIGNTLRFNNGLTLLTITAEELLAVLEHGVAASSLDDENTQGRFPQVAGIEFSFDLTAPEGDRVQSLVVLDEDGNDQDVLVQNSEIVGDPTRSFRMVTLGFLAGGGDGFPFPTRDVVDLAQEDDAPRTGVATFAPDGSEQDALAEYLAANFGEDNPFNVADVDRTEDTRLQNLAFRADTVIDDVTGGGGGGGQPIVIQGSDRSDNITGTDADEIIFGGKIRDRIDGGAGNDEIFGEGGRDVLNGGAGDDLLNGGDLNNLLTGGTGSDTFVLENNGDSRILDFSVGKDLIGLTGGVTFGSVSIEKRGKNALIFNGDNIIGRVMMTKVEDLTTASFVEIA